MHTCLPPSSSIKKEIFKPKDSIPLYSNILLLLSTMSMISYHASGRPFTPAIAKWYAGYCSRVLTSATPLLKKGEGLAYQSPSILERSLRPNIEIFLERADDKCYHAFATPVACAIVDALLQVHDVVGHICKTEEHLYDTTQTSDLYRPLRDNRISFPNEPYGAMFQRSFWECRFTTLTSLQNHWVQVQQWALGMVVALHCLSLYNGNMLKGNLRYLPPFLFTMMALFEEKYKVNYRFEE